MNHTILMVGSEALRSSGIKVDRPTLDWDFIATPEAAAAYIQSLSAASVFAEVKASPDGKYLYVRRHGGLPVIEFELAWPGSTAESLINLVLAEENGHLRELRSQMASGVIVPVSPKVVYTLKMSHRFKKNSVHFEKTRQDILMLRKLGFGKIPRGLGEWFKDRVKETYSYKHPKLQGVKKDAFFSDDGIRYVYDHDAIHQAVKHLEKPAYSYFQPEGEEVGTDKAEFFKLPKVNQLLAVLEECYVLSLERAIVPYDLFGDEQACRKAFRTALEKVCTSITSGWFRKFAWENFDAVLALYDIEYVERFKVYADLGWVAPYNKETSNG